ncbi:MAG: PASTA domain-containing protein, partial [Polyangiaceae bacterium]|nr:PASTA domain-containing protein [Polyangiaceae bacterium]
RLMQPLLLGRIKRGGAVIEDHHPSVRRRVMRTDTARLVADMLTAVTGPGGTGREAAINGYLVAGKTGTAQKANDMGTGYADNRWLASFVGFVPAQDPRIVIAVVIDEPVIAYYGGEVAGPVFRRVGAAALRHLGVPAHGGGQALADHEERERRTAREARLAARERRESGEPPVAAEAVRDSIAVVTPAGPGEVSVPDLRGLSAREVVVTLAAASLEASLEGSGIVIGQEPEAASLVPAGTRVRARLRRPVVRELPPPASAENAVAPINPRAPSAPIAQNLSPRRAP